MDNVAVTPHALGWTDQAVMGIWAQIIDQMSCIIRGEKPIGIINTEVWDSPGFQQKITRFLQETRPD
jgi:phosphoglycerate dehydrogenase-like enzyme